MGVAGHDRDIIFLVPTPHERWNPAVNDKSHMCEFVHSYVCEYILYTVLDGMITFKTKVKKNKNNKKGFYGHNSRTSYNPRLVSRSIGRWAVDWRIICIFKYIYI